MTIPVSSRKRMRTRFPRDPCQNTSAYAGVSINVSAVIFLPTELDAMPNALYRRKFQCDPSMDTTAVPTNLSGHAMFKKADVSGTKNMIVIGRAVSTILIVLPTPQGSTEIQPSLLPLGTLAQAPAVAEAVSDTMGYTLSGLSGSNRCAAHIRLRPSMRLQPSI